MFYPGTMQWGGIAETRSEPWGQLSSHILGQDHCGANGAWIVQFEQASGFGYANYRTVKAYGGMLECGSLGHDYYVSTQHYVKAGSSTVGFWENQWNP
ncbi:hypothetical protein EI42_02410 [Thermosporothrix hazakensis]|jgi:hypothetical protein|uniref:Uncharacterized protein n=1 Tax=Thermosporothrix hazakensis TaxID=644383 RepID=A0A326UAB5_THEHA|nr:hypothetical protein EI42_02410 [Thermosporothrix hazakensis]GCE50776.1 hypothetical protein KTH_56450 [Thermosporothrix hazakensis]